MFVCPVFKGLARSLWHRPCHVILSELLFYDLNLVYSYYIGGFSECVCGIVGFPACLFGTLTLTDNDCGFAHPGDAIM